MTKHFNCLIIDDEPLAIEAIEILLTDYPNFNIVGRCRNAFSAMEFLSKSDIDLIFLDINMPKISGLDFLNIANRNFEVILTTAYREYALQSYDFNVLDYLLKPIKTDRFSKAINKFLEKKKINSELTEKISGKDFLFIRQDRKDIKVNFDEILYIEGMKDYIIIYTKTKKLITKKSLVSIASELPENIFYRVHKSFIISVNQIDAISVDGIEIGNKTIPTSKTYKENLSKLTSNI